MRMTLTGATLSGALLGGLGSGAYGILIGVLYGARLGPLAGAVSGCVVAAVNGALIGASAGAAYWAGDKLQPRSWAARRVWASVLAGVVGTGAAAVLRLWDGVLIGALPTVYFGTAVGAGVGIVIALTAERPVGTEE